MQFAKIDINNWTRKEYFDHYFGNTPCTYSMTVKLDISKLKKDGKKLYPTLLYGVTTIINRHEEFRIALDENGQVGVFSEMLPCYTVFHKETETFSSIWTEFTADYTEFLQNYQKDIDAFGERTGMSAKPNPPENTFPVSMIPWTSFEGFHCGTPEGDRAAAALKQFAEEFQERNPHLRVFNSVIHLDEATPHLHLDFVPVATEQKRGLATRVSLKQALAQQGFTGQSKRETEWNAWVNSEKLVLEQIAQQHSFEVVHGDGGRPHMSLPEYKEAARELEAAKQELQAARAEVSELQAEKESLRETVQELKAVKKVSVNLEKIQPEETMMGNIKGVTLPEIKKLKAMAVRGAEAEQKEKKQQQTIDRLEAENASLQRQLKPSVQKRMKEMQEMSELREQNRDLQYETQWLEQELERERSFSARLMRGINMALIYLEEHLPDNLRPLLDKVREILPEWEQTEQRQQQTHDRGMGGMSL